MRIRGGGTSGPRPLPPQQTRRDHHPLHLARPLIDRGDAHVAVEAGDLAAVVEAVAAVDLEAFLAGAVGGFGGVDLGLGGEAARVFVCSEVAPVIP